MFVAHTIPRVSDEELLVDGRPSILFATLAGVSLGLMTGGAQPIRSGRGNAVQSIAGRALMLFLLGVGLSLLSSGIAIILDYYAVMFLLLLPALFLPRVALVIAAAVLTVAAPLIAEAASAGSGPSGWLTVTVEYLLLGRYPALVWLPFLLVGLLCARSDLGSPRTQRWMVVGGVTAMVLGYGSALAIDGISAEAHSGSTAELVGSGGFAIAVLGALLWATSHRIVKTLLSPLADAGSMPLTVYTLQILLLALVSAFAEMSPWVPDYPGWPLLVGLTLCSLLFAMLWHRFFGAGPLERLLRWLSGFDRRARKNSALTDRSSHT